MQPPLLQVRPSTDIYVNHQLLEASVSLITHLYFTHDVVFFDALLMIRIPEHQGFAYISE